MSAQPAAKSVSPDVVTTSRCKDQIARYFVAALVCASGAVSFLASAQSQEMATDELAEDDALQPFSQGCDVAVPRLVELVARPDFSEAIDRRRQANFLVDLAMCMELTGRVSDALDYANRAAAVDPDSFPAQSARMVLGMEVGKPVDSVDAVEALARIRPAHIRAMTPGYAQLIFDSATDFDGTGALALRFYDTLAQIGWASPAVYSDEEWRVAHARLLIEHGRNDDARQRLANVTEPESVVAIRSQRVFDMLRDESEFEAQLAFETAVPESIARAALTMEHSPRILAAVTKYVNLLEDAVRFEDILKTTDTALRQYEEDPEIFVDAVGNLNWLINQRVYALYSLGHFEEGRMLAQHSIELAGAGRAGDGNLLNYATQLVWEGRPQDAMAVLLKVESTSAPYRTWVESIRSCAAVQLGESASLKASLDYLREQESENASALSTALLCANELEDAAALMIRRLTSRKDRQRALAVLQVRPLTRYDELPARKAVHDRLQALRERDDVRVAVKSVGRIEVVPVIVTKAF